ncbi:hypothetical protein H632_c1897p0 [Helicosporidium sp. ATCC 50920]|nr:hypothetical protein H632_c1897p0 [Helicosporidium sp. ATCC 50920]|eukprot:KDD73717.1 hypothetical protein H632_c1897p0 [Helicosporidium sp. ATCC 50920]
MGVSTGLKVETSTIEGLHRKLVNEATTLPEKYRVLFSLRHVPGELAHNALLDGLKDPSHLFRHEVAYTLGQRQDPAAVEALTGLLGNPEEHPMVRHEAGESLGAIATARCLAPLRAHAADDVAEVAQTCQLALQRIDYLEREHGFRVAEEGAAAESRADGRSAGDNQPSSRFPTVDPTPPAPASTPLPALCSTLLDADSPIFDRYRAMFALRDRGGAEAVAALCQAMEAGDSALLAHEAAYVLGQLQDALAVQALARVLRDGEANAMVRHEAAEALGAIASEEAKALLVEHVEDPEPIVADSCIVALDVLEFEQAGEFQYADLGIPAESATAPQVC